VVSWLRYARDGSHVVVVLNFTPVPRHGYRLGVPEGGAWREAFNSDSHHYGGGDVGNEGQLVAGTQSWMGRPASLELTLPPLGGIVLVRG
jgi:1,4-alpha-glucan branching enzyme